MRWKSDLEARAKGGHPLIAGSRISHPGGVADCWAFDRFIVDSEREKEKRSTTSRGGFSALHLNKKSFFSATISSFSLVEEKCNIPGFRAIYVAFPRTLHPPQSRFRSPLSTCQQPRRSHLPIQWL